MAEHRSTGFPPVSRLDARLLILGSLPGRRSIEAGEYYAHPRNAFWPIMRELYGIHGDYAARCEGLLEAGIALWDVLAASVRPGSLDSAIVKKDAQPNDFVTFLGAHSAIDRIAFNGRTSEALFRRSVLPALDAARYELIPLPSTSPAHAAMRPEKKCAVWGSMLRAGAVPAGTGGDR